MRPRCLCHCCCLLLLLLFPVAHPPPCSPLPKAALRRAVTELLFFASVGDIGRCKEIVTSWSLKVREIRHRRSVISASAGFQTLEPQTLDGFRSHKTHPDPTCLPDPPYAGVGPELQ